MRLRHFVASTLPRSKKNKKRLALSICSPPDSEANQLSPCSQQQWPKSADVECSFTDISWDKYLVGQDLQYVDKPKLRLDDAETDDFININLNVTTDLDSSKCCSYKDINDHSLDQSLDWHDSSFDLQKDSTLADGNFNTVPRARNRIKTNPWLPSPKSSPSGSCTTSPMTSHTTSPTHSDVEHRLVFDSTGDFAFWPIGHSGGSSQVKGHKRGRHDSLESVPSSDSASILQRSFTSDMSDSSVTANERDFALSPDSGVAQVLEDDDCGYQRNRSRSESYCQTVPSVCDYDDVTDVFGDVTDDLQLESPVSFQYEEVFESQLETSHIGAVSASRESVWDKYGTYECLADPKLVSGCHSDVGDSQDTLCCDSTSSEDSYDVESAQNADSSDLDDLDFSSTSFLDDHETRMEAVLESLDSAYDTGSFTGTSTTTDDSAIYSQRVDSPVSTATTDENVCLSPVTPKEVTKRRVTRLRSSLEDKVLRLRREKKIVDEKIRQAQEEERLRLEEKARMQKQITLLRKQVLMRTLSDLRQKLEGQGQRLQTAYDHVIDRQWQEVKKNQAVLTSGVVLHYDKETAL